MSFPLAGFADRTIARLAAATGAKSIAALDGPTLLCERAMMGGMCIPGRTSAGGGCRLFDALGDTIAINLARPADRELLPALFETDTLDPYDQGAIADRIAHSDAAALLMRGRSMGLAIASEHEALPPATPCFELTTGCPATANSRKSPRVVDLSSLWAGPLAAHLLWLAGADVVKVESRARPDALRWGNERFYALLNQGKASVVLELTDAADRQALLSLIAAADIVIESARPRALAQLGIDAAQIVRATPGLVWLTITGHGAEAEAGEWVGFGDDCGVAGGLSAALRAASGASGFVGDAIADPLTGMEAARVAWDAWTSRRGGRFALAMSHVVARAVTATRGENPAQWASALCAWSKAVGKPFPAVQRRPIGALPAWGEHTHSYLERFGLPLMT
ncbi:MAG: CoA transferase [Steroidobacteraceae bacterium]